MQTFTNMSTFIQINSLIVFNGYTKMSKMIYAQEVQDWALSFYILKVKI